MSHNACFCFYIKLSFDLLLSLYCLGCHAMLLFAFNTKLGFDLLLSLYRLGQNMILKGFHTGLC